jgi:hypothetical protein
MIAAEKGARLLQAMPEDAGAAMIAGWRKRVDGAFEAVERMRLAVHRDLKRLVVVVAASFARSHTSPFLLMCCG